MQDGIAAGRRRDIGGAARLDPPARAFRPLRDTAPGPVRVLSGWRHRAQALRAEAAAAVAAGGRAVLILVEPTPRKHKVAFTEGGWWEQTGGLYGPSDRDGARLQAWRRQARVLAERRRLGAICDPDYPD